MFNEPLYQCGRMGKETMICQDFRAPKFSIELEIFDGEGPDPPPLRKSQVQWKYLELWNLGKS